MPGQRCATRTPLGVVRGNNTFVVQLCSAVVGEALAKVANL